MPQLFDMRLRAIRRARAQRLGPELFLFERAFGDCLERIGLARRRFERGLLIGGVDPSWPARLGEVADAVDPFDREAAEDAWAPPTGAYDLILAIGTLDTVNDLRLALRLLREAMTPDGLLIGAVSGGDTLPRLRGAMRAADAVSGAAEPHVHPRIEAAALAPLLEQAGFERPVVDVDRVQAAYPSFDRLVGDLRAMAATNILSARPRWISRPAKMAAVRHFADGGEHGRTLETFEILHFAAWTPRKL